MGRRKTRGQRESRTATARLIIGLIVLAISAAAAVMLAFHSLGSVHLPGCGQGSRCAEAAASAWGAVPFIEWPVSFLGCAYFVALLLTWPLLARRGVSSFFRTGVRLGLAFSVLYLVIIVAKGYACATCLVTHAGNILFWILAERAYRREAPVRGPVLAFGLIFVVVSAVLGIAYTREKGTAEARQESQRTESVTQIVAADTPAHDERPWTGGFTGRYRLGPEKAAVRMVILTDYQCPDCRRIENQAMDLVAQHDDVSLAIKHFPMCSDCNPHFADKNLHGNSCWAARAAEAAGILRGSKGFFAMHSWLFARKGSFTRQDLNAGLRELGFDAAEFTRTMMSDETLRRVEADIEEAAWLGLHYTPMVFINGTQLKGIFAHEALTRTVREVLRHDPPPATARVDQPPPAVEKYIADWQLGRRKLPPADKRPWAFGPEDAKVEIVVWGDYQEPNTAELDELVRELVWERADVRYHFRHYPVNKACNPTTPVDKHPLACLGAKAAETAAELGGTDAYWRMHVWLLEHQAELSEETLRAAVAAQGLDPDAFFTVMESATIASAITEDCQAGRTVGIRSIPHVIVSDRHVPRWRLKGGNAFERILQVALSE